MTEWMDYWKFRDGFASILDERYYPLEWLDSQIWAGFVKVMACDDAAILIEIKTYPGGAMEVHGIAATGDKDSIVLKLIPQAEEWGRSNGCDRATIASREGWKTVLKPHGYEPHQLVLRKGL